MGKDGASILLLIFLFNIRHGPISKIIWECFPTKFLVIDRRVLVALDSLAFLQCHTTISKSSHGFLSASCEQWEVRCSWQWLGDWCLVPPKQGHPSPLCALVCSSHYSLQMTSTSGQVFCWLSIISVVLTGKSRSKY